VDDADRDTLTCQLDADGDGTFETTVPSCTSSSSFVTLTTPGSVTPALRVSDGTHLTTGTAPTITVGAVAADPTFDIVLRNVGPALSSSVDAAFAAAKGRWQAILAKGVPSLTLSDNLAAGSCDLRDEPGLPAGTVIDDLQIDLVVRYIDGPGGVLAGAGPCLVADVDVLPRFGVMEFDLADLSNLIASGTLTAVITHEMGHMLGIGTRWTATKPGVFLTGGGTSDPRFTGARAVAEWSALGGSGSVPVESTGGPGTADSHWRESTFGTELMTGFINGPVNPISRMTIASLADLGYQVDITRADAYSVLSGNLLRSLLAAPEVELRVDRLGPAAGI
jgi:hypothetical protein